MNHLLRLAPLSLALALPLAACSVDVKDDTATKGDGRNDSSVPDARDLEFGPQTPSEAPPVTSSCTPAPALLSRALCVCDRLGGAGTLRTFARPGEAADVGVETDASFAGGVEIQGSAWIDGDLGFAGSATVRDHVFTSGDLGFAGEVSIGDTVAVGGDLGGAGSLSAKTLRVQGKVATAGSVQGDVQPYEAPTATPCGCDAPYDVAGAVVAARTANDNAKIGLSPEITVAGGKTLVLPSGRYYLEKVAAAGVLDIRAEGAVLLYIDGSFDIAGASRIELAPGATLDLFVAGTLAQAGGVVFGDPDRPEAFRLYVGGEGSVLVGAGERDFYGMIYAPTADLVFAGGTTVHGAVFARNLDFAGGLDIAYSEVVPADECIPEETPEADAPR